MDIRACTSLIYTSRTCRVYTHTTLILPITSFFSSSHQPAIATASYFHVLRLPLFGLSMQQSSNSTPSPSSSSRQLTRSRPSWFKMLWGDQKDLKQASNFFLPDSSMACLAPYTARVIAWVGLHYHSAGRGSDRLTWTLCLHIFQFVYGMLYANTVYAYVCMQTNDWNSYSRYIQL